MVMSDNGFVYVSGKLLPCKNGDIYGVVKMNAPEKCLLVERVRSDWL